MRGFGSWLGFLISKPFLPPEIVFGQDFGITRGQADFFTKIYKNGLGELFYRNNITPPSIVFPHEEKPSPNFKPLDLSVRGLVALGGGKDSLTTIALCQEKNEDFDTFTMGDFPFLEAQINQIHKARSSQHLSVQRTLDPQLKTLNTEGATNGHIPISSILAFVSTVVGILRGQKNLIFSNESSANEPTVPGTNINHQYSKTLEFEQDFDRYVTCFIHPEIHYFSYLRKYREIEIAEIFAQKCWENFGDKFMSCNRNFKQEASLKKSSWCGDCPKCAFVFTLFMPFVPREELINLFGKNLLTDPALENTFKSLLGETPTKPFECVGEVEEVRQAFEMAQKEWPEVLGFI